MTTCTKHGLKFHLDCDDCILMIKEATWKGNDYKDTIKFMDKKGFIFHD